MSLRTKLKQLFTGIDEEEEKGYRGRMYSVQVDEETRKNRLDLPEGSYKEFIHGSSAYGKEPDPQPTPTHKKQRKYKQHHKAQQHRAGKVVKVTKKAEYSPQTHIKGGRIVRTMPKGLQKIKEGQERDE